MVNFLNLAQVYRLGNHPKSNILMKKNLFILTCTLLVYTALGQSVLDRKMDFQATNIPVSDALISICEKADINISFDSR